jgi:pimeloyl-ACP methyl ester carboxylesterase
MTTSASQNTSDAAVPVSHHTANVKDIKLHYATAGFGDPLVLLHGWPQSSDEWRDVIPVLAEKYTVIAPDMRGFGASSKARTGYDMNNIADDIRELVLSLGHREIFLAGHDWGGAASYSYAAQFRSEVRRLAIIEMTLPGFGVMEESMVPRPGGQFIWHMGFHSVPNMPQMLIQGREEQYLSWFFEFFSYDPHAVRPEIMRPYVESMRRVGALGSGLQYYVEYFTTAEQNKEHGKQKLTMPVLALGGEACMGESPKRALEHAAENVRGGVIPRCGHWVGEERPDYIAQQLLEFFGEDPR